MERVILASEALVDIDPKLSAKGAIKNPIRFILSFLLLLALLTIFVPEGLFLSLVIIFNFFFLANFLLKFVIFIFSAFLNKASEIMDVADDELPIYTILVPLYKENQKTVNQAIKALEDIDYPADKKDIKLILEESDNETVKHIPSNLSQEFNVVIVPDSQPRTKPKACNYALQEAHGEYVCIYDAEDIPDKNQLKIALAAHKKSNIVQGQLTYYNWQKNWLTKLFYIEYECLFKYYLPALEYFRLPIPLGGTSNHFKVAELNELGGWDAYNVTEDADLGIRYYRASKNVSVINSETREEAPARLKSWMYQRSRWIKGFIQTLIVHLREPFKMMRELGFGKFFGFLFFMGAPTLTFLIMPLALVLSVMVLAGYVVLPNSLEWLTAINLFGGFIFHVVIGIIVAVRSGKMSLLPYSILYPFYWLLHPIAAMISLYEIFFRPYYWHKTSHGEEG